MVQPWLLYKKNVLENKKGTFLSHDHRAAVIHPVPLITQLKDRLKTYVEKAYELAYSSSRPVFSSCARQCMMVYLKQLTADTCKLA